MYCMQIHLPIIIVLFLEFQRFWGSKGLPLESLHRHNVLRGHSASSVDFMVQDLLKQLVQLHSFFFHFFSQKSDY